MSQANGDGHELRNQMAQIGKSWETAWRQSLTYVVKTSSELTFLDSQYVKEQILSSNNTLPSGLMFIQQITKRQMVSLHKK